MYEINRLEKAREQKKVNKKIDYMFHYFFPCNMNKKPTRKISVKPMKLDVIAIAIL